MCQIEDGIYQSTEQEESVMNVTTIGIDLAKNTFSLHGVDAH
jgi:hypothetical protein